MRLVHDTDMLTDGIVVAHTLCWIRTKRNQSILRTTIKALCIHANATYDRGPILRELLDRLQTTYSYLHRVLSHKQALVRA